MTSLPGPVPPADFVVFGGTGDLAARKLLPALYLRDRDGQLPPETRIIALSRAGLDDDGYRDKIRGELSRLRANRRARRGDRRPVPRPAHLRHHRHRGHRARLVGPGRDARRRGPRPCLLPRHRLPRCSDRSAAARSSTNSSTPSPASSSRNRSATTWTSALAINDEVGAVFEERQIFRIDHYLGKETVQNLLVTRFANTLFEPLWNANCIDHVQITVARPSGSGPRRLLRQVRRPARHDPEPPAAAALPGRDGAADVRRTRRVRDEKLGAPGARPITGEG